MGLLLWMMGSERESAVQSAQFSSVQSAAIYPAQTIKRALCQLDNY